MIYSVAEFRKCTREALNKVDDGEEVLIERYGIHYSLRQNEAKVQEVTVEKSTRAKDFLLSVPGVTVADETPEVCAGHPNWRRSCGKKGCEYS